MIFLLGIIGLLMSVVLVASELYDLREIKKQRDFKRSPSARKYRARPLVTVLVVAGSSDDALRTCLDSLVRCDYRKREIIVVDNKRRKLRDAYTTKSVRLFRSTQPMHKALRNAYQRHGNGELIAVINSTQRISSDCISRVVWHFNTDQKIDSIVLNQALVPSYGLLPLWQEFGLHIARMHAKARSMFRLQRTARQIGLVMRHETFMNDTPSRTVYAADCTVQSSRIHLLSPVGQMRPSSLLVVSRLISGLVIPAAVGYFVYVALVLHQPTMLLLIGAIFTIYMLFAIWNDVSLRAAQKLGYSLLIPVSYGILYLYSLLAFFANVGYLIKYTKRGIMKV